MTVNLDEKLHNADWPKRTPDMPDWPAFLKGLTPAQRKTLPAAYLPARAALAAAGFDETKVTRDPGGKAGGQFIKKGTAGVDEGTEEEKEAKQPYATEAARHGYLTSGYTFQRTALALLKPYKDAEGYLPSQIPADAVYKDAVAKALLEKLKDDPKFAAMVEQFKTMPAWERWNVELSRGFHEAVAYAKYLEEHDGSSAGWDSRMAVKPTDMEIGVAMAVGSWAATSSDADIVSLSMQEAAIEEFGLKGISDTLRQNLLGKTDAVIVQGGQRFLRAQYELTQEYFKEAGVTEVEAFRGVHFENKKPPFKLNQQTAEITFNPISSFSTDPGTAYQFAGYGSNVEVDYPHMAQKALIAQSIPVTRILSTPFTGFGCWSESEITVLGDQSTAYVHAWQPAWQDMAAESEVEAVGDPPHSGDEFFLNWRDRRHPQAVG